MQPRVLPDRPQDSVFDIIQRNLLSFNAEQFFIPGTKIKKTETDVNNRVQGIMLQDQMDREGIVEIDSVGQLLGP